MKLILERWRSFLTEKRDFPSLINTLAAERENIKTIGMMTAENPMAQQVTPEENKERNEKLESALRQMNLGYRKIRGKFGNYENSFLIPNIKKEEIIELGNRFEQKSVIWGERVQDKFVFSYIEGDTTIEQRDVVLFGSDVQKRDDFYSQSSKGPEKFVIPFFDDDYEIVKDSGLSNPSYSGPLTEEINKRTDEIFESNRTPKNAWHNRGVSKILRKKTWQSNSPANKKVL